MGVVEWWRRAHDHGIHGGEKVQDNKYQPEKAHYHDEPPRLAHVGAIHYTQYLSSSSNRMVIAGRLRYLIN
jgi:hypothetical protein